MTKIIRTGALALFAVVFTGGLALAQPPAVRDLLKEITSVKAE